LATKGQSRSVYGILQGLASLEPWHIARRNLDRFPSARIATAARCAMLYAKGAEANDGDLLPFAECLADGTDDCIDGTTRIGFGKIGFGRDCFNEFRFVHSCPLRKMLLISERVLRPAPENLLRKPEPYTKHDFPLSTKSRLD
jgi:hypothetical protein